MNETTKNQPPPPPGAPLDPLAITRPAPMLWNYYILCSLLAGPFFFFPLIPLYCKYITLRYRFDAEGVSMSWGVLFRREVVLTYRRIQDIHVSRNLIERWLGLSRVSVQTASGSATAEMTIEGIPQADELRDFLYTRMRGAKGIGEAAPAEAGSAAPADEALVLLRGIREAMERLAGPGASA